MTARRGYSLVEMMAVVVLLGVLGTLTTSVLMALFRADRLVEEEFAAGHALAQLELLLRDDVHAANKAQVEGNRLSLALSKDETIVYTALPEAVTRERVRTGDAEEQVVARDRHVLPRGGELTWRTAEQDGAPWLFVELRPPTEAAQAAKTARVERDARFEIRVGRHPLPDKEPQP